MSRRFLNSAFLLLLAALQGIPSLAQSPAYILTDLGAFPTYPNSSYSYSKAMGINNRGQVVGTSDGEIDYTIDYQAFNYRNSTMTKLTASNLSTFRPSSARAINDAGQIVGEARLNDKSGIYLWDNGVATELGPIPGAIDFTGRYAFSINEAGQVVGFAYYNGRDRPFLWDRTHGMQGLTPSPFALDGAAYDINNKGQVVGVTDDLGAFLWQDGKIEPLSALPGNRGSAAQAINDKGQIVGASDTRLGPYPDYEPIAHAVLWNSPGDIIDLTPASEYYSTAIDINNLGQIIGIDGTDRPFLYSGSKIYTLNSLIVGATYWKVSEVTAINDRGQIAGTGVFFHDGQYFQHAILLTPVPEPDTLCFLMAGVCGIRLVWRRRRVIRARC